MCVCVCFNFIAFRYNIYSTPFELNLQKQDKLYLSSNNLPLKQATLATYDIKDNCIVRLVPPGSSQSASPEEIRTVSSRSRESFRETQEQPTDDPKESLTMTPNRSSQQKTEDSHTDASLLGGNGGNSSSWDTQRSASIVVYILNSRSFRALTGLAPSRPPLLKTEYELEGSQCQ